MAVRKKINFYSYALQLGMIGVMNLNFLVVCCLPLNCVNLNLDDTKPNSMIADLLFSHQSFSYV